MYQHERVKVYTFHKVERQRSLYLETAGNNDDLAWVDQVGVTDLVVQQQNHRQRATESLGDRCEGIARLDSVRSRSLQAIVWDINDLAWVDQIRVRDLGVQ